jgi:hypothetical protein
MKVLGVAAYGDLVGLVALLSEVPLFKYAECPYTTSNHPNFQAGPRFGHQPPPPLRKPAR